MRKSDTVEDYEMGGMIKLQFFPIEETLAAYLIAGRAPLRIVVKNVIVKKHAAGFFSSQCQSPFTNARSKFIAKFPLVNFPALFECISNSFPAFTPLTNTQRVI